MKVNINWDIVLEAMSLLLTEELARRCPKHDGTLLNSISGKVDKDSLKIYMAQYALSLEFGARPHWTSVDNLKKWAKDKLGDENAAYALQKHIAKFGTKPHPFIRETLEQEFVNLLGKALKTKGAVEVEM
jgi:hypothetical protein